MERAFLFNNINTWYDWLLVLTAKTISPPEPNTKYIDLDGMSGSLDLTEALSGEVTYKDRTISATFWTDYGSRNEREALIKQITASLHGKKVKIIEPDDPTHYFNGRVKVKSTKNVLPYAEISIEATCEPWKYALEESNRLVNVTGSVVDVVIYNNGSKTLCPIITVTGSVIINHNGVNTTLSAGSYKISDIRLMRGVNIISVSGNGSITFTYREADL